MQRDHPVAILEIAEKTGDIIDVLQVIEEKRIPLGARHADSSFDVLSLCKWWTDGGMLAAQALKRLLSYWRFHIQKCC